MLWDIKPFIGLGPLAFGMSEAEAGRLEALAGPPATRRTEADGSVSEYRGLALPSLSYRDGGLVYIAVGWRVAEVGWLGGDVFAQPSEILLRLFETTAGAAEAGLGAITFPALGLDANGFYDTKARRFFTPGGGEQDDRTISLYDRREYEKARRETAGAFRRTSFLPR